MSEQQTKAICRWCYGFCRVVVHSENGTLTKIEEDRSDPRVDMILPATRGCAKLNAAREYVYHPARVKFPLKRVGQRGENKWQKIGWEQALDEIAEKLREIKKVHGAEALAMTAGTGRTTMWSLARFNNLFGSPNFMGQGQI